jgi:hypothetical protein
MNFNPASAKLTIGSLDEPTLEVRAQYNPRELQLDKQVPWQTASNRDQRSDAQRQRDPKQDDAELTSAAQRSLTVELLFDRYEMRQSVQPEIDRLEAMSTVREMGSSNEDRRRPHHCVVAWGAAGIRPFRCVIEALSTKFTMFDDDGTPLRAVCSVKLKEVVVMSKAAATNFQQLRMERGWKNP